MAGARSEVKREDTPAVDRPEEQQLFSFIIFWTRVQREDYEKESCSCVFSLTFGPGKDFSFLFNNAGPKVRRRKGTRVSRHEREDKMDVEISLDLRVEISLHPCLLFLSFQLLLTGG